MMIGLIVIPLAVAFVVGLLPFVPEVAQQVVWLTAIVVAGGAALWDWRKRVVDKREREQRHRERMAERGFDGPPRRDGDTGPAGS